MDNVIRIPPHKYIHVLDNNSNIARLEIGPATFIRKEHETLIAGPLNMITLPPRTYCVIRDPVMKDKDNKPILTSFGEVKVAQGEQEIRTAESFPDPFPLYPGESLEGKVEKLINVQQNSAIRLTALRDFVDDKGEKRIAGEEWQREGPFTYIPKIEEQLVCVVNAEVIKPNTALRLRAIRAGKDSQGIQRLEGEEWLIRQQGAYLPKVNEKVVSPVKGEILTDKKCLHLRALKKFKDFYGNIRNPGEEWLITNKNAQMHIPDVYEEIVGVEASITLSTREFCVVLNPVGKDGQNAWGTRKLLKGEKTFFLQPGEALQRGIEKIEILGEDQALLLLANQDFVDEEGAQRISGERWMIKGPREYIPPVEVDIVDRRKSIPLDENEGIYVRDNRTGEVKAFKGQTYLLQAHESLWEKELPNDVEELLAIAATGGSVYVPPKTDEKGNLVYENKKIDPKYKRDKVKVVTYKAPHNSAIQLYDYKLKKHRIVFGPDLVMLGPDENFTVLNLSGGKPKQEGVIKTLALSLGPDFMTDIVIVETSDHARLSLQLSYNWYFKFDKTDEAQVEKVFSVKDFVGDACKSIASRVRGAVSAVNFEDFHHHSSLKIREAVFGKNKEDKSIRDELLFPANLLCITSVDIQNIEITDPKTRDYLTKSINMAIEIASKSQEATSRQQAERLDQEARGQLERQKLEDQARSEEAKIKLLELQAESMSVTLKGKATANARAQAEADKIQAEAMFRQAELKAEALKIQSEAEIDEMKASQKAEVDHKKAIVELEVMKARELADIEIKKFKQIVSAIGRETLVSISKAGPEMKAKLLGGLGLKGYLVTDGKNPINLFNTANGMIADVVKK